MKSLIFTLFILRVLFSPPVPMQTIQYHYNDDSTDQDAWDDWSYEEPDTSGLDPSLWEDDDGVDCSGNDPIL
jgi:hypothetical protein